MNYRVGDRVKINRSLHIGRRCGTVLEVDEKTRLLKVDIPFGDRPWRMVADVFVEPSDAISELGDVTR